MYSKIKNVNVETLRLSESDLDTRRMFDLMAVSGEGQMPLYLHVVERILRDMRTNSQQLLESGVQSGFKYLEFKQKIEEAGFTNLQSGPLNQRLETLESFMKYKAVRKKGVTKTKIAKGTDWTPKVRFYQIPCTANNVSFSSGILLTSIYFYCRQASSRLLTCLVLV